jgi:hypothetical protein
MVHKVCAQNLDDGETDGREIILVRHHVNLDVVAKQVRFVDPYARVVVCVLA